MRNKRLPDQRFKGIKATQSPNTYRLFLAIYPQKPQMDYFRDVIRSLDKEKRNINNVPLDQIHMTLRFLGANVSEASKDILINELKKYEGQYPKPEISITSLRLGFSHQADPRVIFANVAEEPALIELAENLHAIIKNLRLRDTIRWKEKHVYDFHISLARLKGYAGRNIGKRVAGIVEKINLPKPVSFLPDSMAIVQSKITGGAPEYKKLFTIKL